MEHTHTHTAPSALSPVLGGVQQCVLRLLIAAVESEHNAGSMTFYKPAIRLKVMSSGLL